MVSPQLLTRSAIVAMFRAPGVPGMKLMLADKPRRAQTVTTSSSRGTDEPEYRTWIGSAGVLPVCPGLADCNLFQPVSTRPFS